MIRITGVLALVASVVLAVLLIARIHTTELAGAVSGPPPGSSPGPAYSPAPPGTRPVWIVRQGEPSEEEEERQVMAGLPNCSGLGQSDGNGPMRMYWGFQFHDEVARAALAGDEMVIRAKTFRPMVLKSSSVTHITYELRRGKETWSFSEPANGKFVLACGIFVGAPLGLWCAVAGVVALCGALVKAPKGSGC